MDKDGRKPSNDQAKEIDDRLAELNKRHGRKVPRGGKSNRSDAAGYGNAFRLSSEFISAILVSTAIGFGLDWLLGTTPWAMIVFLLLGFVAGVMNVLRASGEMSDYNLKSSRKSADDKDES